MKNVFKLLHGVLFSLAVLVSCQKDHYNLGNPLDKSAIKFQVVQDKKADAGGNTVILMNETPGTISIWDYGTGRSTRQTDTVRYPFKGDYVVKFSVLSGGVLVDLDPVIVHVTEDNLNYVNDPLWTALTGGAGKEKSWVLDTDAKNFAGPISFYGTNNGWLKEGNPWADGVYKTGCYGKDCWVWSPDLGSIYPGIMAKGDYGIMTFSLKGNAVFSAKKLMEGGATETGSYVLNTAAKSLTINNASILRGYKPAKNGITGVSNWTSYTILELDENVLRLGVIRDKDVDGEGACMLVYNFISKEFSDNWKPEVVETGPDEGFDPQFAPGKLLEMIAGPAGGGVMWRLDAAGNPIDWIGKGKGWTTSASSTAGWGWVDKWEAAAANSWILFDRQNGQNVTVNQNGVITRGTYTINEETNEIILNGVKLIQSTDPNNSLNPSTNRIKVVKAFPGKVAQKGIWLGTSYNAEKDEWFAFHYVL